MARFIFDANRLNSTVEQSGKEYNLRLVQRSQSIFTTLLSGLASNYLSAVQGPNYTQALKAVALELARFELALEDVDRDRSTPRSEFLWSTIGYLVLVNQRIPDLGFNDEQFRQFFAELIHVYFQGAVPAAIKELVELFFAAGVEVSEDFITTRGGTGGLDISDEFTFGLDYHVAPGQGFPSDVLDAQSTIRQLVDLIRPAHTLFKIRFVFEEPVSADTPGGGDQAGEIIDSDSWGMSSYYYDDFRTNWSGTAGRDRLGRNQIRLVLGEDHSYDF